MPMTPEEVARLLLAPHLEAIRQTAAEATLLTLLGQPVTEANLRAMLRSNGQGKPPPRRPRAPGIRKAASPRAARRRGQPR